jgi:hypothetical protein
LYYKQQLHITSVLYVVYTVMAVIGFFQWRKLLINNQ